MEQKININKTNVSLFGTYRCSRKLIYFCSQWHVIIMRVYAPCNLYMYLVVPTWKGGSNVKKFPMLFAGPTCLRVH